MARPPKIVLKSDEQKKFVAEVFNLVRTELAPKVGGNVNLGVKLAAEYFAVQEVVVDGKKQLKSRMPSTVTVAELKDAIPQIAAKFADESRQEASNSGRLPYNDELQAEWDAGVYKGQVTVHGIQQRFAAEIKDGVDLTPSMMKAYRDELAVEKARVIERVNEHDDPDEKLVACRSVAHGQEKDFQPTVAFRLERDANNVLVRRKHSQGNEYMEIGNFLVNEEEGVRIPYCKDCREAARAMVREAKERADALRRQLATSVGEEKTKLQKALEEAEGLANLKLTFYTAAGAQRKLDKIKESVEGHTALAAQLRSAGARTFGGAYGTHKDKRNWKVTRGKQ